MRYLDSALEVEITDDGRGRSASGDAGSDWSACGNGSPCTAGSSRPGHGATSGYLVRAIAAD